MRLDLRTWGFIEAWLDTVCFNLHLMYVIQKHSTDLKIGRTTTWPQVVPLMPGSVFPPELQRCQGYPRM